MAAKWFQNNFAPEILVPENRPWENCPLKKIAQSPSENCPLHWTDGIDVLDNIYHFYDSDTDADAVDYYYHYIIIIIIMFPY